MSRAASFLHWYRTLYEIDPAGCDAPEHISRLEASLGVRLPELLKAAYANTSMRHSQMLHLEPLDELRVERDSLVFARDQQGAWRWGVPLERLAEENPRLVSDAHGEFADDEFTLEGWLRYFAIANRPYEQPYLDQPEADESRLTASGWSRFGVDGVCLLTGVWVRDGAVYDGVNLGARDVDQLRAAARSLGVDHGAFDAALVR